MATAKRRASGKGSVNQITLRSRQIHPILSGDAVPRPDPTVHRAYRPLSGLDIEDWRGTHKLSKFDAEAALGFRSVIAYNRECRREVLPIRTEILLRLYEKRPENYPWTRLSFKTLFQQMYGEFIDRFNDPEVQLRARADLEARFTVLFGRSPTRGYAWLRGGDEQAGRKGVKDEPSSYATIERILQKLTQWDNPGEMFETIATQSLKLRGIDIDEIFPIPTLERPPQRGRPGRKPRGEVVEIPAAPREKRPPPAKAAAVKKATPTPPAPVKRVIAAKSPAPAKKTASKKVAPAKTARKRAR